MSWTTLAGKTGDDLKTAIEAVVTGLGAGALGSVGKIWQQISQAVVAADPNTRMFVLTTLTNVLFASPKVPKALRYVIPSFVSMVSGSLRGMLSNPNLDAGTLTSHFATQWTQSNKKREIEDKNGACAGPHDHQPIHRANNAACGGSQTETAITGSIQGLIESHSHRQLCPTCFGKELAAGTVKVEPATSAADKHFLDDLTDAQKRSLAAMRELAQLQLDDIVDEPNGLRLDWAGFEYALLALAGKAAKHIPDTSPVVLKAILADVIDVRAKYAADKGKLAASPALDDARVNIRTHFQRYSGALAVLSIAGKASVPLHREAAAQLRDLLDEWVEDGDRRKLRQLRAAAFAEVESLLGQARNAAKAVGPIAQREAIRYIQLTAGLLAMTVYLYVLGYGINFASRVPWAAALWFGVFSVTYWSVAFWIVKPWVAGTQTQAQNNAIPPHLMTPSAFSSLRWKVLSPFALLSVAGIVYGLAVDFTPRELSNLGWLGWWCTFIAICLAFAAGLMLPIGDSLANAVKSLKPQGDLANSSFVKLAVAMVNYFSPPEKQFVLSSSGALNVKPEPAKWFRDMRTLLTIIATAGGVLLYLLHAYRNEGLAVMNICLLLMLIGMMAEMAMRWNYMLTYAFREKVLHRTLGYVFAVFLLCAIGSVGGGLVLFTASNLADALVSDWFDRKVRHNATAQLDKTATKLFKLEDAPEFRKDADAELVKECTGIPKDLLPVKCRKILAGTTVSASVSVTVNPSEAMCNQYPALPGC